METTAYIALSRQAVLQREMDVVANNLANLNTTAYKGEKMLFVQHLVKSRGDESFIPQKLAFVRDVAQIRDARPGPIDSTGNDFDLAIQKEGYFVVQTPDGDRYTRNGRFQLSQAGELVTHDGNPVLSTAGAPFFLAPEDTQFHVAPDGTVSTNNGELGRIRVVRFDSEQRLQNEGNGLISTDESPQDIDSPHIIQGGLESSNVEPILELSKMIQVHRAYDSVRDFINREDQRERRMLETLVPSA